MFRCAVVRPCQIVGNCEPHLRPGGGVCLCVCAPTQGMREAFRMRKKNLDISKPSPDFFAYFNELCRLFLIVFKKFGKWDYWFGTIRTLFFYCDGFPQRFGRIKSINISYTVPISYTTRHFRLCLFIWIVSCFHVLMYPCTHVLKLLPSALTHK